MNRRDLVSETAKNILKIFPKYSKRSFNNLVTGDEIYKVLCVQF